MKLSRDTWLGIGVISILILVTIAATARQAPTIPYLSTSATSNGTLALKLWLEEMGYTPSGDQATAVFEPTPNADLMFILQPVVAITDDEWSLVEQRVTYGATLVLAGDNVPSLAAFQHLGFPAQPLFQETGGLTVPNPLLTSPAIRTPMPIRSDLSFAPETSDYATLLAAGGQPVLVEFGRGGGRIILCATAEPFSNLALKDTATSSLVLNLIALNSYRNRKTVWFDEWHHGLQLAASQIVGPDQWLRRTPAGHALLFAIAAVFLALLLQGRGFGRPVPPRSELKRRGPLEHVNAIANLGRKAGHRNAVMAQYHARLKRHLARRYSLDPSLPDAEYVRALATYNPALDQPALLQLLQRLAQKNPSEVEMTNLAARASEWMKDGM